MATEMLLVPKERWDRFKKEALERKTYMVNKKVVVSKGDSEDEQREGLEGRKQG